MSTDRDVSGRRRCLVIGGSGTVGRALVAELAAQGARVALTYHTGVDVAEGLTRAHDGVTARQLDLRDPDAVAAAVDEVGRELGGLDAVVHVATKTSTCEPPRFDSILDVDTRAFGELMTVNVTSAFAAVRAALPHMASGGNVVLFGSVDGIKPVPSPVPYAASKAAIYGLVLSLTKALGKLQVRVNMVTPGVLEAGASRTLPDELRAEYLKHCGLRRVGTIAEVTGMAAWLALENTYVTGQNLIVDGGL
jgi:NAD(P)-dependent dehydrogenase (short-subunit alcohol dehydrogenase family)